MIFTMLRPSMATFLPYFSAQLIICCTRSTFDANVAIEGRSVKVLPTKYGSAGTVDITVNVGETKNYKSISARCV